MRLILASSSPRRRELLERAGFKFEVLPSDVAEARRPGEAAPDFVRRVAREKALDVAARLDRPADGALVLGADTVVVIEEAILGKPADGKDAARMLRLLSGRSHQVLTGVCLVRAPHQVVETDHVATLVTFQSLDDDDIQRYVSSGEPLDKAGAYAVQGLASKFVTRIEGDYSNVVGLPVARVYTMLEVYLAVDGAATG